MHRDTEKSREREYPFAILRVLCGKSRFVPYIVADKFSFFYLSSPAIIGDSLGGVST
jgi:hypothetical protein